MTGWLSLVGDFPCCPSFISSCFCFLRCANIVTGKRIVDLQTSLALVQNPANSTGRPTEDAYGRQPFTHPALEGLNSLTNSTKMMLTSRLKVAGLAQKYGLHDVLRWAPRKVGSQLRILPPLTSSVCPANTFM